MIIVRGKGKLTVKNSANVQGTITAKGGSLRSLATVEDRELKVEGSKFKAENHISTVELSATDPSKNSEFILDGAASLNSTDKSAVRNDNNVKGNISVKINKGKIDSSNGNGINLEKKGTGFVKLEVNNGNIRGGKKNKICKAFGFIPAFAILVQNVCRRVWGVVTAGKASS